MMSDTPTRNQVFISYSHRDARWLRRLQVHFAPFERLGKVRYWDDTMITPGSTWRELIISALDRTRVAVLLVSPNFLASDFIATEELPRLLSAAENDGVVIMPVILSPCAFDRVESLAQFQAINPPSQPLSALNSTRREQILVQLATAVERVLNATLSSPALPGRASGRLCEVPSRNPLFGGREPLLEQIHDVLNDSRRIVLYGLAGMGKTETVIEYIYRNRQRYAVVLWLKAESRQQLHASLFTAARFLDLPEWHSPDQTLAVAAVSRWFAQNTGWLAVLDNVDDMRLAQDFLAGGENGHLIITTRMQATIAIAKSFEVESLPLDEGIALLMRRAKMSTSQADFDQVTAADYAAAQTIAREMECLPLALDQAGAYLEETGCGVQTYLALWSTHRAKLLAQRSSSSLRNADSVTTTWVLVCQQLEKSNPQAIALLKLLAFLHPEGISEDILREGSALLGPELAAVMGDPWQMNEVIRESLRFSLLRRDAKSHALRMHRLFQAVLRDAMDPATQASWAERAVRVVEHGFPEAKFAHWERCERLLAHARVCAVSIATWRLSAPYAARLLHELGYYLYQRGHYQEATHFIERAVSMRQTILGTQHADYGRTLAVQGQLLHARGKLIEAEQSFQEALVALQGVLGIEHEEVALVLSDLAGLKLDQGFLVDAESLLHRALTIAQQALGLEHPHVVQMVNNLGAVYFKQGNYAEAERLFSRVLAIREKVLPAQHPSIAQAYNNLAAACACQSRYPEAEQFYNKALAIRESSLGPTDPRIAETLYNLALLYLKQHAWDPAEAGLKRALAIREASQGPDHPSTADVLASFAELRLAQNLLDEAETLYKRVLRIRESGLGHEHPDVGRTLVGLAKTSQGRGDTLQAESLLHEALRILAQGLGPHHPDVTDALAKLSALHSA